MLARSLQASVSITTRSRTHSRYLSQMATTQLGLQNKDRQHLFKHSERLETGRALVQDVWSIFNAVNLPADCINLGQGYMNFSPPGFVIDAAGDALNTVAANHYSHPKGRIRLREAIKNFYSPSFNRTLDVETEMVVTSGANEGQYAIFAAFLEHGDEVIVLEPFFDQYISNIAFNGGVPVYVPLHPHVSKSDSKLVDWAINFDELERAVTPKTKMIVVNTPHNPVAKVFKKDELLKISELAERHNLLVMADEVYDTLTFDGHEHVRIANLPGMWDRTITVLSAGKAFAATGWRVGWCIGAPQLIKYVLAATTRIVFAVNSPLQEAAAAGLEQANANKFFEKQLAEYVERRDILIGAFKQLGLKYTTAEGTYFALLDISEVEWPADYSFPKVLEGRGRDYKACWFLAQEIGVSAIPVSEFYCPEHQSIGERFARFAFCKDVQTLKQAGERLQSLKKYIKSSQ